MGTFEPDESKCNEMREEQCWGAGRGKGPVFLDSPLHLAYIPII